VLKVAFYIDDLNLESYDLSNILNGNPGIGGTEYITIKVAKHLSDEGVNVVLYSPEQLRLPSGIKFKQSKKIEKVVSVCEKENTILIFRLYSGVHSDILSIIAKYPKSKILFWLHLTPAQNLITDLAQLKQVKGFICVENNQRVRLIDGLFQNKLFTIPHPAIYNTPNYVKPNYEIPNLCYLGALVPQKGFHLLADIWPIIKVKHPKLKLYVIGSGDLYKKNYYKNNKLAISETYKDRIFKNLSPDDSSVVFLGNLDSGERQKIFEKCGIGIANPLGTTETFCISAVEMQQFGLVTIAAKKFGLTDTVLHNQTGMLVKNKTQFIKAIDRLVTSEVLRIKMSSHAIGYVHNKYNSKKILNYWIDLLNNIDNETSELVLLDLRKIDKKSTQALVGLINRKFLWIFGIRWPMLITVWSRLRSIKSIF
jgi:glycosyltransferase involved in cell wall biosynthesis